MAREALEAAGVGPALAGDRHHQPARDRGGLGPAAPASRSTARSSGRTAAPPRAATSCAQPGTSRSSASAPGSCSTRTSPARRSSGCCARAEWPSGRACFGTIDSWLVYKLTGRHVTDYSNASRTLLFDIRDARLGRRAVRAARRATGVRCPSRVPSAGVLRRDRRARRRGARWPGIAGDQQAALYGQACHSPGLGKNTYGTGSFVLQNAGGAAPPPADGLLTTVAWGVEERVDYALEAAIFVTGAAVQWLRDGLGVIEPPPRPRGWRGRSTRNDGVYFVPAFTGLGSPHWDPYARGTIVGPDARHRHGAPGPRGARGDRLPDRRRRAGDGGRRRACGSRS